MMLLACQGGCLYLCIDMKKAPTQKVNLTSAHLDNERQEALRKILPEVFSEDKIDWDRLKAVLGETVDFGREKFGFTWSGKGQAIKNVLIPSKATLKPDEKESVKFNESDNLFIEGDNLEVLKLLQKSYFEKVKMIYIDPPYNTGGDFVYKDNFTSPLKNYLEQTGQKDSEGNSLQTNRETSGRFHSDWLSMMYPRLKLAWNLLRNDGVIFVSIDDNEVHHLRILMNEIFGEENFVNLFVWKKNSSGKTVSRQFPVNIEYVFMFAKKIEELDFNVVFKPLSEATIRMYSKNDNDGRGKYRLYPMQKTGSPGPETTYDYIDNSGKVWKCPEKGWRMVKEKIKALENEGRLCLENNTISEKAYWNERENEGKFADTLWDDIDEGNVGTAELSEIFNGVVFDYPKPTNLIRRMIQIGTSKSDTVLDFFAGSGTTAHSVLLQNKEDGGTRKFVLVQLPEKTDEKSTAFKEGYKTISDITKERIRRVLRLEKIEDGFKVFNLSQSNYIENNFEFDPEKSDEENQEVFEDYLKKAQQKSLFEKTNNIDVVYENIVKEGLSLNSGVEEVRVGKSTFHKAVDGEKELYICLDKKIDASTTKELSSPSFKEKTIILLDEALSDSEKANIALNAELKTI